MPTPSSERQGKSAADARVGAIRHTQPLDSADNYRTALALVSTSSSVKAGLERAKRTLVPLAQKTGAAGTALLRSEEWFEFYVSPYELFQLGDTGADGQLEVKAVQRAKKRLIQELQLNDGKVGWLHDHAIDVSAAHKLDDELLDPIKARYHRAIFRCKPLLNFLTRGDVRHFLYSDDYFPKAVLDLLSEEPAFRAFLSTPYARQYNTVLTRAMKQSLVNVVEALLSGRRWVQSADEDVCFDGASRHLIDVVASVRVFAREGRERKIALREVEEFLRSHALPELFNLLPPSFGFQQIEVVRAMRDLAGDTLNLHRDAERARAILTLCTGFVSHDAELKKRLDEDLEDIDRVIAEERKHESRLELGPDRSFAITKDGIRDGATFLPAGSVAALRWGITVTGGAGAERYAYVFGARGDDGSSATVSWTADAPGAPEQSRRFGELVEAAKRYHVDAVVEKLRTRLLAGERLVVGPCALIKLGLSFEAHGWRAREWHFLAWNEAKLETRDDQVVVSDPARGEAAVSVSASDIDNAVLLPLLQIRMGEGRALAETTSENQGVTERGAADPFAFVRRPTAPATSTPTAKTSGHSLGLVGTVAIAILVVLLKVATRPSSTTPAPKRDPALYKVPADSIRPYTPPKTPAVPEPDPKPRFEPVPDRKQVEADKSKLERSRTSIGK